MRSQRAILGAGLAVLLLIGAISVFFDVKSKADARWVNHTLGVLKELSDARLLVRRAESAARGFALTDDQYFAIEYREAVDQIDPAFSELIEITKDNPTQGPLLTTTEQIVARQLAVTGDLVRLRETGAAAGLAVLTAKAEGREAMDSITENFDRLAAEEQRLLAIRSAQSQQTGRLLVAADLSGGALILLLAAILIRQSRLSSRKLEGSLRYKEVENQALEIAVAERTRHLVAAQEELRHSTSVLKGTFISIAEAILVVDADGTILLANLAAERLFGYRLGMTMDQLQAQNVSYQADGSTILATHDTPTARAMRGEQFDQEEVVIRQPDRRDPIHIVVSSRSLHDTAGEFTGAALVCHDVTRVREAERKLHQSQKLDAIGKLTGGVAHDFNNMLTVIAGTTETLVTELGDRADLQAVAAMIHQAADRCTELIKHLLAFARKQPLQPRNVDINETIRDMGKLLRPTLGEQIEIESILENRISTVCIDPSQLANALLNLAINARDAMPNGGKLILETANVVLDEAYALINPDVRPGAYAMIAVSDTGTGMSPEVRDKVFEPFFTTKETGRGTGLGLSMVYGFVKQSGGHIKVYSEQGHGTTIRLYLPIAIGRVDVAVARVEPAQGAGETILVVEDDELVRGFVIAQLHSLGYRTLAAADSRAALAYLERGQPFEVLFTDIVMPGGMTGRELADEVTRRRPGTKVLYTSGYTENAIVHHGRLDPGVMLLSKPYLKSELSSMVRRAIGETVARTLGSGSIPLADTSIAARKRQQAATSQALSSSC
jgi:PAS domain S-box-containing protein